MSTSIRDLKRNYRLQLAQHRVLPTHDRAIPLPFSTGNPLFDAALTDKLVVTASLNEAEHLRRAWGLVSGATLDDVRTLAEHADGLLNDYKLLLALRAWRDGKDELCRVFLWALPWGWRLRFPVSVIKPAATLFTGWRKELSFRLIDEPRFPALRDLYREFLSKAPGVVVLKYRRAIQASAALLRMRFEGQRETSIHDLCFHNGKRGSADASLEPVGTYLRARTELARGNMVAFLRELNGGPHEIPITSFMGLLGSHGLRLSEPRTPSLQQLRCEVRHSHRVAFAAS